MRSGSMMGIVYKAETISLTDIPFLNNIYPQVELALRSVIKGGFEILQFNGVVRVGCGVSLPLRFEDKMSRPIDYGLKERANILKRLWETRQIKFKEYIRCRYYLAQWGYSIGFDLLKVRASFLGKYIKAIHFDYVSIFMAPFALVKYLVVKLREKYVSE